MADQAVGSIVELTGEAQAVSGSGTRPLSQGSPVFQGDTILTRADSSLEIVFEDDTSFSQGENARSVVNSYVYDADDASGSSFLLEMGKGMFRTVTGEIAKQNPDNFKLQSPMALIGIRGTVVNSEIQEAFEKIGVETIGKGHVLVVQDSLGNIQFISDPMQILDVIQGRPLAGPRAMTRQEINEFHTHAPNGLDSDPARQAELGARLDAAESEARSEDAARTAEEAQAEVDKAEDALDAAEQALAQAQASGDPEAIAQAQAALAAAQQALAQAQAAAAQAAADADAAARDADAAAEKLESVLRPPEDPEAYESGGEDEGGDDNGDEIVQAVLIQVDDQGNILGFEVDLGGQEEQSPQGQTDEPEDDPDTEIVNSAPQVDTETRSTQEHQSFQGQLAATDPDGDPLSYSLVEGPDSGTLVLNADGSFEYSPDADSSGAVSFTYTVDDGQGGTGTGTVQITIQAVDEVLTGTDAHDTLYGLGGDDDISGGSGDDALYGGEGNDTLDGGEGNDVLEGDEGDDIFMAGAGLDTLDGGDGYNTLSFENIQAENGVEVDLDGGWARAMDNDGYSTLFEYELSHIHGVVGSDYNDTLDGDVGDETLFGGKGDDSLFGDSGNDSLDGGEGDDTLDGGFGNDSFYGGSGNDSLSGGFGDDTLSYAQSSYAVVADLSNDYAKGMDDGTTMFKDTLSGMENLVGSDYGDTLSGDANANAISGGLGDDSLSGGSGSDSLAGEDGNDTLSGGSGDDSLSGGEGNDTIYTGTGDDLAAGGAGDDLLVAGETGSDAYSGGEGDDTLSYEKSGYAVSGDLSQGVVTATDNGQIFFDSLEGIENLVGSAYADTLTGDANANLVSGGSGSDSISGGNGDDSLYGGGGMDVISGDGGSNFIDGGAGEDFISYDWSGEAISLTMDDGVIVSHGEGTDTLTNVEYILGSDSDDSFTGDGGSMVYEGGEGSDTIDGGVEEDGDMEAGVSYFNDIDREGDGVYVNLGYDPDEDGWVEVTDGWGNIDYLQNIEGIVGSAYGDTLIGQDDTNNWFDPMGGEDVIDGGTLSGSLVTNTLSYYYTLDSDYTLNHDSLSGIYAQLNYDAESDNPFDHSYVVDPWGSTDTFTNINYIKGSGYDDSITLNVTTEYGGDNSLVFFANGMSGDDTLTGTLNAGTGVSYDDNPAGVVVSLEDGSATDGWGDTDTIENMVMVVGSDYGDTITGLSGSGDTLYGDEGNDRFIATSGEDQINGGSGFDYVDYSGLSDASYGLYYNAAEGGLAILKDMQTPADVWFQDSLEDVEAIGGTDADDTLTAHTQSMAFYGNGGDDSLTGGSGSDTLKGQDGSDTLVGGEGDDQIAGGSGVDTLTGSDGNDTFSFSEASVQDGTANDDLITDFEISSNGNAVDVLKFVEGSQGLGFSSTGSEDGVLFTLFDAGNSEADPVDTTDYQIVAITGATVGNCWDWSDVADLIETAVSDVETGDGTYFILSDEGGNESRVYFWEGDTNTDCCTGQVDASELHLVATLDAIDQSELAALTADNFQVEADNELVFG